MLAQCPNGVATTKDFTPAYAKIFPLGDSRKYSEIVFNNFDKDKDGVVTFSDLLTGLAFIVKGSVDQKLLWIFRYIQLFFTLSIKVKIFRDLNVLFSRLYDLNDNGYITKSEMITSVTSIYEMVKNCQIIGYAVGKHVDKLFEKMDFNRDGVISRDEFLQSCLNVRFFICNLQFVFNKI